MLLTLLFLQVPLQSLWRVERWHSSHLGHHRRWLHLYCIFNGESFIKYSLRSLYRYARDITLVVLMQLLTSLFAARHKCSHSDTSWDLSSRLVFEDRDCVSLSCVFQVLALCHIAVGQQLNLHWLHKVMCQVWDRVDICVCMCVYVWVAYLSTLLFLPGVSIFLTLSPTLLIFHFSL